MHTFFETLSVAGAILLAIVSAIIVLTLFFRGLVMQVLKEARQAKGLSLADVCRRTGIDRSALSKLENVTNENPTIDTLLRYAEFVGKRLEIRVLDK